MLSIIANIIGFIAFMVAAIWLIMKADEMKGLSGRALRGAIWIATIIMIAASIHSWWRAGPAVTHDDYCPGPPISSAC